MGNSCPEGNKLIGDVCYGPCPEGTKQLPNGACSLGCPSGFKQSGGTCLRTKPTEYNRGSGYTTREECSRVTSTECQSCGTRWYPPCMFDFVPASCNNCKRPCPDGSLDGVCEVPTITPVVTPSYISWTTIMLIAVVVVIVLSVVIGLFFHTKPDIPGIILGDPTNDAYSHLEAVTSGRRGEGLIYV